jgi:flagellar basal-body rod protein FlgB
MIEALDGGAVRGMLETPQMAQIGRFLDVLAFRDQLIASNLANVDTPGYQTVDINLEQELERAPGSLQFASFSPAPVVHEVRGLMERPDGNNVSVEREGLLLAETQLRYNVAIELLRAEFHRLSSAIEEGGTQS